MSVDESTADVSPHLEEDENYFVSMTDMMVGILFVFIILLMVFALNFRQQTDTSENRIKELRDLSQYAQTLATQLQDLQSEVQIELASIDQADRVRAELLQNLQERLSALGIKVEIDETNGVLRLTENAVRFPVNSAELDGLAAGNVRKIALVLSELLPVYGIGGTRPAHLETVFIEGHTDVTGKDDRNWQLSTERAVATYRELTAAQAGLRALRNRAGTEVLSVAGYSSTRNVPGIASSDFDAQRRIDLRFVMDVDNRQRLDQVLELTEEMKKQIDDLVRAAEQANAP